MTITIEDWLVFCERTIAGHRRVIDRLDDAQLNTVPGLPDANSPFQIVTHAFAATEWWCSHVVLGRPSERVRHEEFASTGTAADLIAAADRLRALLRDLAPELAAATALAEDAVTTEDGLDGEWTVGAALMHVHEELAQHLGHLEVTADLVAST